METSRLFKRYCEIAAISDVGADIWGSDACKEYIAQATGCEAEDALSALLKMRLEQEQFLAGNRERRPFQSIEEVRAAAEESALNNLHGKLSRYSPEERRCLLINTLQGIHQMLDRPLTDQELAQRAHWPTDLLERQTARMIVSAAERLVGEYAGQTLPQSDAAVEERALTNAPLLSACSAAAAVAAYAEYAELRDMPECVGAASAAAACIADAVAKEDAPVSSDYTSLSEDILDYVLFAAELIAVSCITGLLLCAPLMTFLASVSAIADGAMPFALATFGKAFVEVMSMMTNVLQILAGSLGVFVLTSGLSRLIEAQKQQAVAVGKDEEIASPVLEENTAPADAFDEDDDSDDEDEDGEDCWIAVESENEDAYV